MFWSMGDRSPRRQFTLRADVKLTAGRSGNWPSCDPFARNRCSEQRGMSSKDTGQRFIREAVFNNCVSITTCQTAERQAPNRELSPFGQVRMAYRVTTRYVRHGAGSALLTGVALFGVPALFGIHFGLNDLVIGLLETLLMIPLGLLIYVSLPNLFDDLFNTLSDNSVIGPLGTHGVYPYSLDHR